MARHFLFGRLGERIADGGTLERALWAVEGGLASGLWRLFGSLPVERASALGAALGRAFGPRLKKHRHVLANLGIAFPDRPERELRSLAIESWANAGRMIAELPHLAELVANTGERLRIVGSEGLHDRLARRPAIFLTAHLGNWNLAPIGPVHLGIPMTVIYRKQTNPRLERLFERARRELPWRHLEVEDAARGMMRELEAGRSVGLLPDQRFEGGELVPFFGRPAPTPVGPARIAVKLGLPFVPGRVIRESGCRFRIEIHPPLEPDPAIRDPRARAFALTLELNRLFERWIRERPEQWLCAKRRWPREPHRAPADLAEASP
ncbi:MAG: lysophospholipid acyltransferase family protein [Geminicoccaceae bacterium]|nr:lysophospholipid acyltransferase family protein [Geminicoccaceae bacterium]